jgi:FHA domain
VDVLGKARRLESKIARTIDDAAQRVSRSGRREALEVVHAVLDAVEREVQPAGRGRHVFPFNRLKLAVAAPSSAARARLEAVFEGEPALQERVVDRLRAAGCEVIGLNVKTTYVPEAEPEWTNPDFHIEFLRLGKSAQTASVADAAAPPRIDLTILEGAAETAAYAFTQPRIDLGRRAEVRDSRNRLIRTNHVAFADADGLNQTVSRRHAHIGYAADTAAYRVYDDRSAHGTAVLRGGRTIPVPPGSLGVRLHSGDEIALGEARLGVTIAQGAAIEN